jgi:hypothetical protein
MGSELTATLGSGTYSTTGLATEIKTKMEVAGSSNYTITWSQTTGLWTILSDGSFFSILNNTGTNQNVSVLKQSLGFPNTDKTGGLTYTGSLISIHTQESVVFDLQTTQDITCVALFWSKEDGIRLSDSAVVKIEANATDSWSSPAVSQTLTIDTTYQVASHFFVTAQEYRYWRVTIQDPQNPYLFVELGLVWIGEDVGFDEPENGFKFKISDPSNSTRTASGQLYTDENPLVTQLEFDYKYVLYEDYVSLENAYRENGSSIPVLVALDDQGSVFNSNHFLLYGHMNKDFSGNHLSYNLFNGGLRITESG